MAVLWENNMYENYSVNSSPRAKKSPPESYCIAVTVP